MNTEATGSATDPDPTLNPAFMFHTAYLAPDEQLDAFRTVASVMGEATSPKRDAHKTGFYAEMTVYALGDLPIGTVTTEDSILTRHRRTGSVFGDDYWMLTGLLNGSARTVLDDREIIVPKGGLELRNMRDAHTAIGNSTQMIVPLSRQDFDDIAPLLDRLSRDDLAGRYHALLPGYLLSLVKAAPTIRHSEASVIRQATIDMIRACITLTPDAIAAAERPILSAQQELAKSFIRHNLANPELSMETIQAALGVSRRQMHKLFSAHGGVMNYVRAQRLNACRVELLDLERHTRLRDIAEKYGFSEGTHFNRQFKAMFGYAPSEVREAGRDMEGSPATPILEAPRRRFLGLDS
ncbi:helix-turn-helix transcriptional regulator [Ciceribacter sp. L1K23]|uniref:AraC family transcriptional regulator n=1 Tax=Ciceribacter sp. L1K23 TaxID=2820276 RepID=UPI001B83048F|nr:AraC family transcriptional regulator [Ciceribacter sp. L1K23]MBR0554599.1 helix-turn-helix transcriptional regulator [Ciceribacter sp. L1K23]